MSSIASELSRASNTLDNLIISGRVPTTVTTFNFFIQFQNKYPDHWDQKPHLSKIQLITLSTNIL